VQSEVYSEPEGGNAGLTSAHIVEETYEGAGKPSGVASELAAGIGAAAGGNQTGAGKYLSREETRNYELSKQVIERTTAAGQLKRLTIAAIVDQELQASAVNQVREVLEAASGYDETRGDRLVIQSMAIAAEEVAEESAKQAEAAAAAQESQQRLAVIVRYASGLVAVAVLAAAILIGSRQVRNALATAAQQIHEADELPAEAKQLRQPGVEVGEAVQVASEAEAETEELAETVRKIAGERPEAVVKQLQRWDSGG